MSKRKTKSQSKSQDLIRTDVWDLVANPQQKHQMILTIQEYRKFLKPLVLLVNAQWISLVDLRSKERVNQVEKLIHQTADNPNPKHQYYRRVCDLKEKLAAAARLSFNYVVARTLIQQAGTKKFCLSPTISDLEW